MGSSSEIEQNKKKKKISSSQSFMSIFMHADGWDMVLMGLGLFGAFGDGISMPVMLLVTSKLMNSFGHSQISLSESFTHSINKVDSLSLPPFFFIPFMFLGVIMFLCIVMQLNCLCKRLIALLLRILIS